MGIGLGISSTAMSLAALKPRLETWSRPTMFNAASVRTGTTCAPGIHQTTAHLDGLIGSNPARHPKNNLFAVQRAVRFRVGRDGHARPGSEAIGEAERLLLFVGGSLRNLGCVHS